MKATAQFIFEPGQTKKRQVADDLRRRISRGDMSIGDSLGDMFTMGDYYGCSFGTVREAQQVLVEEGLLSEIRAGMPTRVIAVPSSGRNSSRADVDTLARLKKLRRDLDSVIATFDA